MCNFDLKITNVNSRYGGAAHDSFIWGNSELCEEWQRGYNNEGNNNSSIDTHFLDPTTYMIGGLEWG